MSIDWPLISTAINKTTGDSITLKNPQSVSGGCINEAWKVEDQQHRTWFVKLNRPSRAPMFEA
ncbi:MAG TPA: fructosamine kinase family protein, partial [Thiothrix sp.]|nr:fructosamine kinase family protein [Thiothrix sp.]